MGQINEPLHILIINRYFYPDISSVPQLLTELSEDLIAAGYRVSILCSGNSYNGKEKYPKFENHKGIDIHRVSNIHGRNKSKLFRVLEALSFFIMLFIKSRKVKNVHLMLILSSPPLLSVIGRWIGKLKKAKTIYLVEDVHPELAVSLGYLKQQGLIFKWVRKCNRYVLKSVNKIIVLGKHMRKKIEEIYPPASPKITIIPNWADGNHIKPQEKENNPLIKKWKLQDKFIIQYSGNMGLAHDFKTILNGINQLKENKHIHFIFIGDGPRKKEITQFIKTHQLTNVNLYPYQPYSNLPTSLNACDIALVSLENNTQGLLAPSKIYGILAAGKPFILIGGQNNEIADISLSHQIGKIVAQNDTKGFTTAIEDYYLHRETLTEERTKARKIFETYFHREIAVKKYIETIKDTITGNSQ
ncbi:MAG: glycosyltransferase family 4 protein [bacterium]|nr:glycosyltransferase family 4 protein [bacterium]